MALESSGFESVAARDLLTVSQLNRALATWLGQGFALVRVVGELAGLTRAASGHLYFTLKDGQAAVRCVMFRQRAMLLARGLSEGDRVELTARVTLYEPRGDLQLMVDSMRPAGQGDLFAAFVRLKEKLASEGLFDAARKRDLPSLPRRIGVVTSRDAAALRDLVTTLARRAPHVQVLLYPALVQGARAPAELLAAVQLAAQRCEVDTLILCRGGGSIEDLAAFNDEALARAVAALPMPTVSGVGHETDFSIIDFVADVRAPTPTAAAELAARPRQDWIDEIGAVYESLHDAMQWQLQTATQRLDEAGRRLLSPQQRLRSQAQLLAELALRLSAQARHRLSESQTRLAALQLRLARRRPSQDALESALRKAVHRMRENMANCLNRTSRRLDIAQARLAGLDPHLVLARGYTFVTDPLGTPVLSAAAAAPGQTLRLHWADGGRQVTVDGQDPVPSVGKMQAVKDD